MKLKNNRTCKISIRLNDDEMDSLMLKANLSGFSISSYIRYIILHSKPPIHKFDKAMIIELSRIGNNINQIAKYINTNKSLDNVVLKSLISIESLLNKLVV
ncbi:putative mobilization protein MobC [Campylobacter blaseri]|uniref:Plasmid mobilization relaxosome protein MobC n=1 Tax=Campylobacter blaseri TaxID=2042961 RepID=A0A2P8QYV4_9BACT|nr:plasmid mobilization relaxosome protein MobC [Campylobacter blaseri]PSM51436.1 plasmid mobilization relaxosome protein MobC [Campylobacter blaseri]PSM52885.1 plasmid mobilization relaxosome protein MobC [Campylobacter blaseri]QKF86560.1 putative mobilization protein MobC [Campylobacter blaseri]